MGSIVADGEREAIVRAARVEPVMALDWHARTVDDLIRRRRGIAQYPIDVPIRSSPESASASDEAPS